jgi:ketosteroid isomerase-like protein
MDVHERFTDTWVKMPNGQWQCVASHGSPVKM